MIKSDNESNADVLKTPDDIKSREELEIPQGQIIQDNSEDQVLSHEAHVIQLPDGQIVQVTDGQALQTIDGQLILNSFTPINSQLNSEQLISLSGQQLNEFVILTQPEDRSSLEG